MMRRIATLTLATGLAAALLPDAATAQRFENQVAIFAALDKVTARISKLEVELNKTSTFGSLKVTPRVCYSRALDEPPKTTTFVEVEETLLDGQQKRLFSGWMFAESPGLNAVEHPIFDVWLTGCAQPTSSRPTTARGNQPGQVGQPGDAEAAPRRRVRQ